MDQIVVTASTGRELGSRPSKRLRAEGRLPAVLYGLGKEPVTLSVDYAELRDALKTEAGMNTILRLDIEGSRETAMVRTVQRDPIKRLVTHVDFLRVDLDQKIKVNVPIHLIGEAEAVLSQGGLIEQNLFELEVEVSADDIPSEIVVDQSNLTLESRISVGDLELPDGVETTVAEDVAVVSPVVSRAARMAIEEAEAEEAGEDGEDSDEEGDDADGSADGADDEEEEEG